MGHVSQITREQSIRNLMRRGLTIACIQSALHCHSVVNLEPNEALVAPAQSLLFVTRGDTADFFETRRDVR